MGKARPKCPDCHKQLRVKALTDSDEHVYSKWRYCEECGWDERGKFEVTVWGLEGDILAKAWEATADELAEIEERYGDDPHATIMADPIHQNELKSGHQ